jgi:hypothetical protein
MANILDGVVPSLLQGVSQQIPRERLPGQVSEQVNMVSDLVTGIRRRPGIQYIDSIGSLGAINPLSVLSQYVELDTTGWHVFLDAKQGNIITFKDDFSVKHVTPASYVATSDGKADKLRMVVDAGFVWVLNTEKKPVLLNQDAGKQDPGRSGFLWVKTGAFSKQYQVTINVTQGGVASTFSKTYTTPTGQNSGDAAQSTPEGVANGLFALLTAGDKPAWLTVVKDGAYIAFTVAAGYTDCTVSTSSGNSYMGTSADMTVQLITDLPPSLPTGTDGFVCAVGTNSKSLQYYKWILATKTWQETGSYGSYTVIGDMPQRFDISPTGVANVTAPVFEGRVSGDDENNPYPQFIGKTLTGISAYQGRLVVMSGAYLNFSASNKPTRFMRSTVTQLLSEDPIERGSGSATAASYTYAIPYNRDLVAISATHQSVVPASNAGISPQSAVVLLSTKQAIDTLAQPTVVGRSLMYCAPISADYFGIGELLPSDTTSSQYITNELTNHIPRYMRGRCRSIATSPAASIALFTSSVDVRELLVHEYLWTTTEKLQNAWHKWVAPLDILSVHFAKDILIITLLSGNSLLLCTLDTRDSAYYSSGELKPLLDLYISSSVVDVGTHKEAPLPNWLVGVDVALLGASSTVVDMVGEPVQILGVVGGTIKLHKSYTGSTVVLGFKYNSVLGLTPPVMKDQNGYAISLDKTTLLRYAPTVQNSGDFDVTISTPKTGELIDDDGHVLKWASHELGLKRSRIAGQSTIIIPCRTLANETECTFNTSSTRELNVIGVEYTIKTVRKRQRI